MSEVVLTPVEGKPGVFKDASGNQFLDQKLADNLITQRIGEEKAKIEAKSGEAIAKAEQALTESKAKIATLETAGASAEGANKALEETFAVITSGMSDDAKALIPEHGTIADKIKFINKNAKVFFATASVQTPAKIDPPKAPGDAPADTNAHTSQEIPSWQEILKDPRGARAKLGV